MFADYIGFFLSRYHYLSLGILCSIIISSTTTTSSFLIIILPFFVISFIQSTWVIIRSSSARSVCLLSLLRSLRLGCSIHLLGLSILSFCKDC